MPPLVTRILLTILMFPFASLVYLSTYWAFQLQLIFGGATAGAEFIGSGICTWVFIVVYWCVLWRRALQPASPTRIAQMLAAVLVGVAGAVAIGWLVNLITLRPLVVGFVASAAAPLLWLTAIIFFWRESPPERELRLRNTHPPIPCPVCGYNLTGLNATRCPECGRHFTIDELLEKQAARATEIESAN